MNDTIIFIDAETEDEIRQYIGKGLIIPNIGDHVLIEDFKGKVVERIFDYQGDWCDHSVCVTIILKLSTTHD